MDFLLEFFLELYLELVAEFVPEDGLKKWQIITLKIFSVLVCVGIIALFVVGFSIVGENKRTGVWLIAIGGALLAVQVGLFIRTVVKEYRKDMQNGKENKKDS